MKICLVHDDFLQSGGAESLFATIASLYPEAPIYTSLVDWQKVPQSIDKSRIRVSWMQKIPLSQHIFKALLPAYPFAFESFDFDDFDLVISSTTRFAKGIITKPKIIHITYLNSIPRFLWENVAQENYLPTSGKWVLKPLFKWLKRWDFVSSSRVDYYIANSENIKQKISNTYDRSSEVIYPFANTAYFKPAKIHNWHLKSKHYYLIVSRLVKWKKIDIAIEASADLKKNLIVVGDGPDKKRLEKIAKDKGANVEFLGRVSLDNLRQLYQNCQALIITQEEDFGISALEAQSCAKPVVAYRSGGVKEIIIDHSTGILYDKQEKDSLKDAITRLSQLKWNGKTARRNALKFSKAVFIKNLKEFIFAAENHGLLGRG